MDYRRSLRQWSRSGWEGPGLVFASSIFLYLFLPALLALYYVSPRPTRNAVLLAAGLLFYAWGEQGYVLLILAAVGVNYLLARVVEWCAKCDRQRWAVAAAVIFNVGLLVAFKYANF